MKGKSFYIFRLRLLFFFFILSILLTGCSSKNKQAYFIGVDPSWFPLNVYGKEPNLLAFTNEVLKRISEIEGIPLQKVTTSWDDLLDGLDKGKYHGVLSPMEPYVFNLTSYTFSDPFLLTGPVLVVREDATTSNIEKRHEKEIAIFSESEEELLMQKYPDSLPRLYNQVPPAFVDVIVGTLDGALVPSLEASSYVLDLYSTKLKILTKPMTGRGLKLITLKGEYPHLIKAFNKGMSHLKDSGEYEKLLRKWKVGYWALSR
jgi:polar amino acid transport system substrate-binding protein